VAGAPAAASAAAVAETSVAGVAEASVAVVADWVLPIFLSPVDGFINR
jgi:hypothetical protein